jgi:hypothetical protein
MPAGIFGLIMPSLTPQKAFVRSDQIDLIAVFKSEQTADARRRVIDYLFPLFDEFSDLDVEKCWSKTTTHEEIFIPMPTSAAYRAELELCNGILEHSRGQIGDAVMLALLREFLHTHIWIYHPSGSRTNKKGDPRDWARPELYTMYFVYEKDITPDGLKYPAARVIDRERSAIVNSMQAWFLRLLEERRGASGFRLEKFL